VIIGTSITTEVWRWKSNSVAWMELISLINQQMHLRYTDI
jgi:hypothetical protein